METAVLTTILATIPPTLAAVAALVVAFRARRDNKKDLTIIHELVNSNLQAVKDKLEIALQEIQRLQKYPRVG